MYFFNTIVGFLFCTVVLGCNYTDNVEHLNYYTPEFDLPGLDQLLLLSAVSYRVEVGKIQTEWKIPDSFPLLDKLRVTYATRLKQCHMFSMYIQCSHAYFATIYISRVITAIQEVEKKKKKNILYRNAQQLIEISKIVSSSIVKLLAILIHLNYVPPQWVVVMFMYSNVLKEKLQEPVDLNKNLKNSEVGPGSVSSISTVENNNISQNPGPGQEEPPITSNSIFDEPIQVKVNRKPSLSRTDSKITLVEQDQKSSTPQDRILGDPDINPMKTSEEYTPGPKQLKSLWSLTQDARSITQNFVNECSVKLGIKFSNAVVMVDTRQDLVERFIKINKSLKEYYNFVVKKQKGPTVKRVTYNTLWGFRSVIHENNTAFLILTAFNDKATLNIDWNDLEQRFQNTFQSQADQTEPLLSSYMSIWNTSSGAGTSLKEVIRTVVLRYVYVNTINCDNMYDQVNKMEEPYKYINWLQIHCIKIKQLVVDAIKYLGNDSFLKSLIPALTNFPINPVKEASNIIIKVGRQLNQQSGLLNVVAINEVKPLYTQEPCMLSFQRYEVLFSPQRASLNKALEYIKEVKNYFKHLDFKMLDTIKKSAMNDWIQSADPV